MSFHKEYEMLFQLNAQLGSGYNNTFSKAQAEIAQLQKEIQSLSKVQTDISAYEKQQSAVDATRRKLEALQQQYDNIQKEIQETEGFSSALENKLLSKQQQIDKTSASLEQQTQKLEQMDTALKDAGVNTSNLSHESSRLGAQIEDLKERQEEAASSADDFGEQSVSAFDAINQAIAAAGIATALHEIYEAYMECVYVAGDFEAGMSNVKALTGASAEEMNLLSEKAKELGADTKFSAQEAADAMGYMGMAGWNAQEMLSGMDGVLNLAAASGEDLAQVSDIVTDSLTAFGLQASDTARFSDVLAMAATKSNTNVALMGETFRYVAPVAGALKYTVEDTAIAIGLMANAGIKGSQSGTALRAMMTNLAKPTKQVQYYIDALGISLTDASGQVKPFNVLMGEMRGAFEDLTEAQKAENAAGIAGAEGMSGMLAIVNASEEDFESLTTNINNATGAAQRMAGIKMDNLNGDLELMNGSWEALDTTIGEQFIPEMRILYGLGADAGDLLNDFVQEHPALVKAVAAFIGVIGAATAGLGAYAATTKVVIPLMKTLTAIHGVSTFMGVATAIGAVTAAVVGLATAADDGIPSVKELTESAQQMEETLDEANTVYSDTVESTLAAASVADNYITKLEEMGDYASLSAEDQREYHNILALLCQTVPELANHIDLENNVIRGGTDALRANTEEWKRNALQQAYQEKLTAIYAANADVMIEAEKNSIGLTKANTDLQAANEKLYDSNVRLDELQKESVDKAQEYYEKTGKYKDATEFLTQEYYDLCDSIWYTEQEIESAEKTSDAYKEAMEEDAEAIEAAKAEMELAEEAVQNLTGATESGSFSTEEAAAQYESVAASVENVMAKVNTLTESYNEAYQAAYDSITGQYAIWDEAAEVVATDAGTINSALESQISYWQDYNTNLESLRERTGDIEGLGEVIASFADGSADSVNAIAGLASASDEDLAAMVESWKGLQAEQKLAAGSIADIKEDFGRIMDELAAELAADIEAMDLGTEAAESAKATIQGYVNAAYDMLPQVQSAYARIASAATAALTPPNVNSAGNIPGYAVGTDSAAPGFAYVGEHGPELVYFGGGEQVMTAAETAAILSPPTPVEAAYTRDRGPVSISVSFPIHGSATPETVEALREYGDEFAERVMDVLEDAGIETARRSY